MSLNDNFVDALKKHMARNQLSAYRLARLAGLNPSTVQRILNGDVSPTLETAGKILNVTVPTNAVSTFFRV